MFQKIGDLPSGLDGLKAVGRVSKEDYEEMLEPFLDEARRQERRVRFLCEIGPEFESIEPSALWEDAKLGFRYLRVFDGCAFVTDTGWIREATNVARFLMPCPVRVFSVSDRNKAIEWLRALDRHPQVSHRLLPKAGVIVVEVNGALRAHDFDSLTATADNWIDAHGLLQGIVIHTREFPGWENLGALVRHLRFVRDHHRKVERIALAANGKMATLAPRLGEHFIAATVKTFGYDDLPKAIAWASGVEDELKTKPEVRSDAGAV